MKIGICPNCGAEKISGSGFHRICIPCLRKKRRGDPEYLRKEREWHARTYKPRTEEERKRRREIRKLKKQLNKIFG